SDAFIALPGGFGTMDEVFETLTWAQLHLHQKPVILYNPNGFYDLLLAQADLMVKEGFLNTTSRALLMSTSDIHRLLPMLVSFKPPTSDQWANTRRSSCQTPAILSKSYNPALLPIIIIGIPRR
ncbi:MAG TPA: LOG family protein, partial [Saprospiraceae bacterium]|nr:LOG family protein [Saprospiraceae bacterium]